MEKFALGFGASVLVVLATLAAGCDEDIAATLAPDAGASDAVATTDSSVDAASDAAVCAPQPIGSFAPTWKPPVGFNQKKCTPTQIQTLASCVWPSPGRDEAACKTFFDAPANADCKQCGYTTTAGATLGAIVSNGESVQANYAGCIALVAGDTSSTGCGAKVQAYELCLDEACVKACPVTASDSASFARFEKCQNDAKAGVCKTFTDAAACQNGVLGAGGSAAQCAPVVADFGARAVYYLNLFCGGPSDAGTDG